MDDEDLDAMFAEAAGQGVEPSPRLLVRILADAAAAQPVPKPVGAALKWRRWQWFSGLGGGRAVVGLSLAGLTGVFLGMAQPDAVLSLASLNAQPEATVDRLELLPSVDLSWTGN
jgi:hypothetical protein